MRTLTNGAAESSIQAAILTYRTCRTRLPTFILNDSMTASKPAILVAMPFLSMGGGEAVVSQICRSLNRKGCRIVVITTVPLMACQGDTTEWFADSACAIHHLPVLLAQNEWAPFILDLIARHRIELVWLVGSSYLYEMLPAIKRRFPQVSVVDLLFNPVGHTANHLKYREYIDHVTVEHDGI